MENNRIILSPLPFGEPLGSYNATVARSNLFTENRLNFENGIFTGVQYDASEFVRHWCLLTSSTTFQDLQDPSDFWGLSSVDHIYDCYQLQLLKTPNHSSEIPVPDSILVWNKSLNSSGHIAVITEVNPELSIIRVAEQGKSNTAWPGNYSRELRLVNDEGKYSVVDGDSEVLGWVKITNNHVEHLNGQSFKRVDAVKNLENEYVNASSPSENMFVDDPEGISFIPSQGTYAYYVFSNHYAEKIFRATLELHYIAIQATERVIGSDELLSTFKIPPQLWEMIRTSWNRSRKSISGRFDFGIDGKKVKMLEYNADSAGMIVETGIIQQRWAKFIEGDVGVGAGSRLKQGFIDGFFNVCGGEKVHLLVDGSEYDEILMAVYIKEILAEAGIESKEVISCKDLRWSDDRQSILDTDGVPLKYVWKTWNWFTIFSDYLKGEQNDLGVSLSEVCMHPGIQVFEPMWKVVTTNKALLAVMWEMFPNHPNLLETHWEASEGFEGRGYVSKPIQGRLGQNITIFGNDDKILEEISGDFAGNENVYQELFDMTQVNGLYPLMCSWVANERPAGFIIRESQKLITEYTSPIICCRIVNDSDLQ